MSEQRLELIAEEDQEMISGALLGWADDDVAALWEKHDMDGHFDFFRDVVEMCTHVVWGEEEVDINYPNRCFGWFKVETDDAPALKKEMRDRVMELIEEIK